MPQPLLSLAGLPVSDPLTTVTLAALTLLAAAASVAALLRLRAREETPDHPGRGLWKLQMSLLGLCIVGSTLLFIYRWLIVYHRWQPLEAHVDGLLLLAALFGATVLFVQSRAHVRGLSVFALPLLTVLLAWAICASAWTFHPFQIDSVWKLFHQIGVYVGTLFFAVAAIAGAMYLYVEHRLRRKRDPIGGSPLASLEALERVVIRTSALGFALLTLGILTGVVITLSDRAAPHPGWWYGLKVALGLVAWSFCALVMSVRHATAFRGARAAWLSIACLVLMLATFATTNALPRDHAATQPGAPRAGEVS